MARLAIAFAGAAVGGAIAGPAGAQVGWTAGAIAGGILFGPSVPDQEGPRLEDLSVGQAQEGVDIPMSWGDNRIPGQMIWAADLEEVKDSEDIGGKGGTGGSYISYTYFGTFAVSLGQPQPSSKLRRVWANKKLIYDASAAADSVSADYPFTFYDGTQTTPDSIIESYVGTGNVPSYKGQSLLVCDSWNLTEEFGNRIPVIEAEIVTDATVGKATTTYIVGDAANNLGYIQYSTNTKKIYASYSGNFGANYGFVIVIDPFSKTVIDTRLFTGYAGACNIYVFSREFQTETKDYIFVYVQHLVTADLIQIFDLSNDWALVDSWTNSNNGWRALADSSSTLLVSYVGPVYQTYDKSSGTRATITVETGHTYIGQFALHAGGNNFLIPLKRTSDSKLIWAVYDADGASWDVSEASSYTQTDITLFRDPIEAADGYVYWAANDTTGTSYPIFVRTSTSGTEIDVVDLDALGVADTFSASSGEPYLFYDDADASLYFQADNITYRYEVFTQNLTSYSGTLGESWALFHRETGIAWSGKETVGTDATLYANRLNTVEPDLILVRDILDDLAEKASITSGLRDFTALDATIGGFVAGKQTSTRANMEPLLKYALADGVVTDWKLKGIELGGLSVATITNAKTVGGGRFEHQRPHDIALPRIIELQYMSSDADLQPNMATAEWYTAPGGNKVPVSWSMTFADSVAADRAQQLLQLAHAQEQYSFSLGPEYHYLEPADIVTLPGNVRAKLTEVNRGSNGIIECVAVADNPNDLTASSAAGGLGIDPAIIYATSPAQLLILDGPLLRDVDADHPGPYLTAFTYGAGFNGVGFFASVDNTAFAGVASIGSEPTVGVCSTVPSAVDWEDWDTTNTLRVNILTGDTLSNATAAQVLAGANAAAWGKVGRWEIVQFQTATLISTGVYDLTNLLRGRRGTDPYIDDHTTDDYFVMLDAATMARQILTNATIGELRYYKAAVSGTPIADALLKTWTVNDQPLTPYSPIQPTSSYTSPDLTLGWTRRTRKGGSYGGDNSLTDNVGGSLAEDSEEYTIQTLNGAGAVLGTYTATTNSKVITDTNLTNDYGAVPPTVYWRVAQNSAVIGAGNYIVTQFHYIVTPAELVIEGLSPTAFWKLDETTGTTATDSSGNGNNGEYLNSPTLAQTALTTLGTSVLFDRTAGSYMRAPLKLDATHTAWSVCVFFNSTQFASAGETKDVFFASGNYLEIRYTQSTGAYECYMRDSTSTNNVLTATTSPATGTTHCLIVTFGDESGSNWVRLWVDGSNEASVNIGSATLGTSGTYTGVGNASFQPRAYADCVAMWNNLRLTTQNITDISAAAV